MALPKTSELADPAGGSERGIHSHAHDPNGSALHGAELKFSAGISGSGVVPSPPRRQRSSTVSTSTPACSVDELQKLCDTLSLQHAEVKRERDDFARQIASLPRSTTEAEKALLSIRQARDTLLTRNHELMARLSQAEDQLAELQNVHDDLTLAHSRAGEELRAARQESDGLRRKALELSEQRMAQLETERSQAAVIADLQQQLTALSGERDEARTRAVQSEENGGSIAAAERESMATLTVELAAARQQIELLSSARDALRKQIPAGQATLPEKIAVPLTPPPAPSILLPTVVEDATAAADSQVRVRKDSGLSALQKRLAALRIDPADPASLDQFAKQLQLLAKRSQTLGAIAPARLAAACAEFVTWLRKMPARIPAALENLDETLALLDRLAAIEDSALLPDPTGAFVYSVDADADNCECVSMALEKVGLRTKYAMRPEAALADLGGNACDLVILDVELPGMDGFELHARLRKLEHHRTTPIIFLSGHHSIAERVAGLGEGYDRFVAKPYNLTDLSLKALTMVVQARLGA
jgi:CheY-like chemotaxis protein